MNAQSELLLDLAEQAGWMTTGQAAHRFGRAQATIRWWAHRRWITGRVCDDGLIRYPVGQLWYAEHAARTGRRNTRRKAAA